MIVDALQYGFFSRESFEGLRAAKVGCVTATLGFWEGAVDSLDAMARWRDFAGVFSDVFAIARNGRQIRDIAASGRTAVLLGYQNAALYEGRIRFVELFAELGVRVVQLTYNNQNELGGGCYEEEDSGLSRFGSDVVREMNRAGILVDLSHSGERTTLDAIRHSLKPVAVSHANPASLVKHKRNKTDAVLKALAERGGVVGCTAYRHLTGERYSSSLAAWCELVAKTVEIAGIDHVGIGSARGHNSSPGELDWMRMGRWTRAIDYGAGSATRPGLVPPPDWLSEVRNLGQIPEALRRVGFNAAEVDKITHGNWLRIYDAVFAA
jgi:membrane dipeptidase